MAFLEVHESIPYNPTIKKITKNFQIFQKKNFFQKKKKKFQKKIFFSKKKFQKKIFFFGFFFFFFLFFFFFFFFFFFDFFFFFFFWNFFFMSCIFSSRVYATRKLQKLQSPVGDCNFEAFYQSVFILYSVTTECSEIKLVPGISQPSKFFHLICS